MLDEDIALGRPLPKKALDAGCGAGVIGICAARALISAGGEDGVFVRCQDRDELARLFALRNAAKNRVPPSALEAHAEPLLSGPEGERWDLILTNIPAKAGEPVLKDFVARSAGLLRPGGRAIMVAVCELADFFREQIALAGAELLSQTEGAGHSVFAYCAGSAGPFEPVGLDCGLLEQHPFYARTVASSKIGGAFVRIESVYGAGGFDDAGGAARVAAKLAARVGFAAGASKLLVHEPGQGFFPCWLLDFLRDGANPGEALKVVLSGRNVLALEAARHNVSRRLPEHSEAEGAAAVPAADLLLGREALDEAAGGMRYDGIAAFPELLPQSSLPKGTNQLADLWDSVPPLLAPGGIFLAAFSSSDAGRFDGKKPAGFARLGNVRRDGFRAFAYRRER